MNAYKDATQFIESLANVGTYQKKRTQKEAKERLNNVKRFLDFLGNPEYNLKIIHIAGTSGKGSVVSMLHNILQADNKFVGSYTSPHTTVFCERIKVGDKYISEKELIKCTNFLKDKMDEYISQKPKVKNQKSSLNFFEFSFCLAIYYFSKQNCEYAVIETGCGGRCDASNAVQKPIFTIITNIGPDHLDIFKTMESLAKEKAGIIKRGAPLLTGETQKRWLEIFKKERIGNKQAEIKSIDYKELKNIKMDLEGTEFEYKEEKYSLQMVGAHQARNAILAIECANALKIKKSSIKKGIKQAFYPARMELISKYPTIIIDGAHNSDKIKASFDFIKKQKLATKNQNKRYLILAMAKNKTFGNLSDFISFFDEIYFTRFSNPFRKAMSFSEFIKVAKDKKNIYYNHYAEDALKAVLTKIKKNDLLIITGSIFLAGELRKYWYPAESIIKNRKAK